MKRRQQIAGAVELKILFCDFWFKISNRDSFNAGMILRNSPCSKNMLTDLFKLERFFVLLISIVHEYIRTGWLILLISLFPYFLHTKRFKIQFYYRSSILHGLVDPFYFCFQGFAWPTDGTHQFCKFKSFQIG